VPVFLYEKLAETFSFTPSTEVPASTIELCISIFEAA
jgi:hypothetical protein